MPTSHRPPSAQAENAERAVRAYRAMRDHLLVEGGLYRESTPESTSGNPFAFVWPFEEAAKATLCMAGIPEIGAEYRADVAESGRARERYWDRGGRHCLSRKPSYASYVLQPLGRGGDTFYDDNAWIALDLIQQHRMFGDDAALARAATVFEFVRAGWCRDRRAHPGGLYWVDARWNRDRGAATNCGATMLALHLHELLAPPTMEYVDRAHTLYRWARDSLLATDGPTAGLYSDKVLGDGQIDRTQWIYNQGTPIAAAVLLHHLTGDQGYLDEARSIADAALAYYGRDGFMGQPLIFTAIFFRNLLQLDAVSPSPEYREAMQAYADRLWADDTVHDRKTGLFRLDRATPNYTLLDQAGAVQIFALLAWTRGQYGLLT